MRTGTDHGRSREHAPRGARTAGVVALVVAQLLTLATAACAETVPAETQLPIYFKLLTYDRTLWETPAPKLRIGLLHRFGDQTSYRSLIALREALAASAHKTINGVAFAHTILGWHDADDLARQIAQADIEVLYVTAGHRDHLDVISRIARQRGILTLAAETGSVGLGLSVGLRHDGERIRIEVDIASLAAEGHQLDARVLRLCEVVNR